MLFPITTPIVHADQGALDAEAYAAVMNGDTNALQKALANLDVDQGDGDGQTLLHHAAARDNGDVGRNMVEILLNAGANPNLLSRDDETPLHRAVRCGHLLVMQRLLTGGADPNVPNGKGDTPLHVAARNGQMLTVPMLLDFHGNPWVPNHRGQIAWQVAYDHEHLVMATHLRNQPPCIPTTVERRPKR